MMSKLIPKMYTRGLHTALHAYNTSNSNNIIRITIVVILSVVIIMIARV